MGDNDVICLSSDDEFVQDVLPRKKLKTNNPLTVKMEPKEMGKNNIVCTRKRKNSKDSEKTDSKLIKKTKIENKVIDEITIESPNQAENKGNWPNKAIGEDSGSKRRVESRKDVTENGTISIGKLKPEQTSESFKLANQSKSNDSRAVPVHNGKQKMQSATSDSKESNGKMLDASRSCYMKTTSQTLVVNPAAKLKDSENSENPTSIKSNSLYKFFETKDEFATSMNRATPIAKLQIEISKPVFSTIAADKNANRSRSKSQDKTPEISATSSKIVDIVENPKADSAAITVEGRPDRANTPAKKSGDCRTIRKPSNSPEVLILPRIDTLMASTTASDKTGVKALFSNSIDGASTLEEKIMQHIVTSSSGIPKSTEKSQLPCVRDFQILNDDSQENTLYNGIKDKIVSLLKSATDGSETTKPLSKSESRGSMTQKKNDEKVIMRINPQQLPASLSKFNQSKPDMEKTSKPTKNSTSYNSTESDAKIANEAEKPMSKKPMPDCSQSPDNNLEKSRSALSSVRQNSRNSKIAEHVKEISESVSKSVDFEPQPGCSKTPDEIDQKPRLIVAHKKPVLNQDAHDTFSMFLSLCLQTDRCSDMETVVTKLKRYYEELNPAYAASQAFRDTLNEKRELIMQKGKKLVYHYIQLLKEDMKAKRGIKVHVSKTRDAKNTADGVEEDAEEEDTERAWRQRQKIKKIEMAMKECQKRIKKYEEAEVDFEDDNNSDYIKLDRFKERMVQLYNQMCKYTHEHPDAGRAYLRPKHLRVTQIPCINQAINSFINSKLSFNKIKANKRLSFVDGLIFPDYVDILECVEKVNKDQELKLDKRAMQNLAEQAFIRMGKYLQEARQNDYWDTFSMNLDNDIDPATSDLDLAEKLSRNKEIADANEKKVFEEFVRRQEIGKTKDKGDSPSESEDDEDEEEEEEEESDKTVNRSDESDVEMSIGEDSDPENEKGNEEDRLKVLEVISEAPQAEDEVCKVEDDAKHISSNNNVEASKPTADTRVSSASSPKSTEGKEAKTIEVILDDVDTEDGESNPVQEERAQQPLRIRSFAKPPESWQCSQEFNKETNEDHGSKPEDLARIDEEISVVSYLPEQEKVVQNLTSNDETVVGVASNTNTKNIESTATSTSRLSNIQALNVVSVSTNSNHGQNSRYLMIPPRVTRPVQLPPSLTQSNVQSTKIATVSRPPEIPATNTRPIAGIPPQLKQPTLPNAQQQVRVAISGNFGSPPASQVKVRMPVFTSTPIQLPQSQPKDFVYAQSTKYHTPSQQINQVQVRPLSNEKCVIQLSQMQPRLNSTRIQAAHIQPRPLNSPQLIRSGISATSTPFQPRPLNFTPLIRGGISATSTPVQPRPNSSQQNKVLMPVNSTSAPCPPIQVLRLNNGKYVISDNSGIPREQQVERNSAQQQQKITDRVSSVVAPVKVANVVGQPTSAVLKLRINDNTVQTVQLQSGQTVRVTLPGDQNQRTSKSGPKRKNEIL